MRESSSPFALTREIVAKRVPGMIDEHDFEGQLDQLLDQRARFEAARIDACACQTERDWDNYHAQMGRFHDMRDAFLQRYLPLVTAIRHVPVDLRRAWELPPD